MNNGTGGSGRPPEPPNVTDATALDLAALIREGDCIGWTGASGEPLTLMALLNDAMDRLPANVTGLSNVGISEALDPARVKGHMRIKALGGTGTNRRFQAVGALDVLPLNYGSLPELVRDGTLPVHVILATLAPDGARLRLSPLVCHLLDGLKSARVVIAEINDRAPVLYGDTEVERADIDHVIHTSRPMIAVRDTKPGAIEAAISAHVVRLVPDGATIQVGIGVLPDAILAALADKKNLGLHSGTIGDRVADLIEAGVITNRRKPIDTGLTVTAGLLGTERVYRFCHKNERILIRTPRYTHDNRVHAEIPNLIGINSALEVDLTGQVNAEVAGGRHLGLVGGQADYMRGCMRSKGGRGIVAFESTARGGKLSRIVPKIADGIVTTSRADADVVVTEYGIADLRGRTVSERAKALIAVAHPDFRKGLQAAAEGLV